MLRWITLLLVVAFAFPTAARDTGPDFYVAMTSCVFVFAKDGVAQTESVDGHVLMCTRAGKKVRCLYRAGSGSDVSVTWSVIAETSGELTLSQGLAGADFMQVSGATHMATSTMRYAPGASGVFGVRYCTGVYMTAWEFEAAQKLSDQEDE